MNESNDFNDSFDSFCWIFIFERFLELIKCWVKDQSRLISLIDADQKIGEVELTNVGGREESLSNFSYNFSVVNSVLNFLSFFFDWFSYQLEDRSNMESELSVSLTNIGLKGSSCLFLDRNSINEKIILKNLEVLRWIFNKIKGGINWRFKWLIVEGWSIDCFTNWNSSFEWFNSHNKSDDTINNFIWVIILVGSLDLLESSVKKQKSFIFIANAIKKGFDIKFAAIGFQDTLLNLSNFNLIRGLFSELSLLRS